MKRIIHIICIAAFVWVLQSCTATRRFGTTIEYDEKNPCQINMILQIGIQGTDEDVAKVKSELESCFDKECFIPCDDNKEKGCKTKITFVIKKWGSLNEDEQNAFHYVKMINNDGLPSNAYIGKPNAVISGVNGCVWRRDEPPGTYCHEVLHLFGLEDKYCSRIFDTVAGAIITERICIPPPEPNGGLCCFPSTGERRCGAPCPGHEHNIMGTLYAGLTCENIKDVLKGAGLDNCPKECCASNMTFTKPPDQLYLTPGYLHFGDKNTNFGAVGGSIGYIKYISPSFGITIDGGFYLHAEKDNNIKITSGLLNVTGGVIYNANHKSGALSGITITAHAQAGVSNYMQKISYPGNSSNDNRISLHFNAGAAMDLKLNPKWSIRLLQADYAPTFFYDAIQHNYRFGAGVIYNLNR